MTLRLCDCKRKTEAKGNERQLYMPSFDPLDWIIAERCHQRPVLIQETWVLVGKKPTDGCDANRK